MRYRTVTARICQTAVVVAAFCGVARAQVAMPEFEWQAVSETLSVATRPVSNGELLDWLNGVHPPMAMLQSGITSASGIHFMGQKWQGNREAAASVDTLTAYRYVNWLTTGGASTETGVYELVDQPLYSFSTGEYLRPSGIVLGEGVTIQRGPDAPYFIPTWDEYVAAESARTLGVDGVRELSYYGPVILDEGMSHITWSTEHYATMGEFGIGYQQLGELRIYRPALPGEWVPPDPIEPDPDPDPVYPAIVPSDLQFNWVEVGPNLKAADRPVAVGDFVKWANYTGIEMVQPAVLGEPWNLLPTQPSAACNVWDRNWTQLPSGEYVVCEGIDPTEAASGVDWWAAARFINWLESDGATLETGAYDLDGEPPLQSWGEYGGTKTLKEGSTYRLGPGSSSEIDGMHRPAGEGPYPKPKQPIEIDPSTENPVMELVPAPLSWHEHNDITDAIVSSPEWDGIADGRRWGIRPHMLISDAGEEPEDPVDPDPDPTCLPTDTDCDGDVDMVDLLAVIGDWTGAAAAGLGPNFIPQGWTGAQVAEVPEPRGDLLGIIAALAVVASGRKLQVT